MNKKHGDRHELVSGRASRRGYVRGRKAVAAITAACLVFGPLTPALGAPPSKPGSSTTTTSHTGSSSNVAWSGATTITSATTTSGVNYSSTSADQNAILIDTATGTSVVLESPTVVKSGGTSASDDYSFYGINSAIMCKGGGTTTITGGSVTTNAAGANGIFSYGANNGSTNAAGDGTTVIISGTTINTTGQGSGGIMTTYGGITKATNLTVNTTGGSSAAIRTDRGGGWVVVDGGSYTSSGLGSPAIYSTADVDVSNASLVSNLAEGVCIEGNGSVELTGCSLTASNTQKNGKSLYYDAIMIYQSMSGDATGTGSVFTMTGGIITNANGHVFHVTNTSATINLNGVNIVNTGSGVLLSVTNDGWSGNANSAVVNASNQVLTGDIVVSSAATSASDAASSLTLNLTNGSAFTGAISDGAGGANFAGAAVTIDEGSTWTLTGDSYVSSVSGAGSLNYNGHTLIVDGVAYTAENPYAGMSSQGVTVELGEGEMARMYNPNSGEHFYTASQGEAQLLVGAGWRYEGVGWTAPSSGSAVYRLYNPNGGDHHYTASSGERDLLVAAGWRYEGVGWYSASSTGVALYRQYNPNATSGSHNYTTSSGERDLLVAAGWRDEGIGWYALS